MKTKIEKLAESLDFRSQQELFNDLTECYQNEDKSKCKKMFNELTFEGKLEYIKHVSRSLNNKQGDNICHFYLDLL